jgi:hypothetical protein
MAKWRKSESMGHALSREGRGIAKGVVKELLSIATLGLFRPKKYYHRDSRKGRKW